MAPAYPPTSDPFTTFRLTVASVLTHPGLGPAVQALVQQQSEASLDATQVLRDHGVVLPPDCTIELTSRSTTRSADQSGGIVDEPDSLFAICVFINDTVHCLFLQPPVVLT